MLIGFMMRAVVVVRLEEVLLVGRLVVVRVVVMVRTEIIDFRGSRRVHWVQTRRVWPGIIP